MTPAQTGVTPSGQTTGTADTTTGPTAAATAADVKSGVTVYDQSGGMVGKIDSVSGGNAVVKAGDVRAAIPITSFAKNDKGLVISMTKAELEAKAPPAKEEKKPAPKKTK